MPLRCSRGATGHRGRPATADHGTRQHVACWDRYSCAGRTRTPAPGRNLRPFRAPRLALPSAARGPTGPARPQERLVLVLRLFEGVARSRWLPAWGSPSTGFGRPAPERCPSCVAAPPPPARPPPGPGGLSGRPRVREGRLEAAQIGLAASRADGCRLAALAAEQGPQLRRGSLLRLARLGPHPAPPPPPPIRAASYEPAGPQGGRGPADAEPAASPVPPQPAGGPDHSAAA